MKSVRNVLATAALFTALLVPSAQGALLSYGSSGLGLQIPDGSPTGISQTFTVSDPNFEIANISVSLNISGGYNGDLYVFLALQPVSGSAITSILLNRVGRTGASDFGFSTAGLNVNLTSDSYQNIHDVSSPTAGGTYLADGRAINPLGSFVGSSSTAGLDIFNGLNPNGNWTLFFADLSGGEQALLES